MNLHEIPAAPHDLLHWSHANIIGNGFCETLMGVNGHHGCAAEDLLNQIDDPPSHDAWICECRTCGYYADHTQRGHYFLGHRDHNGNYICDPCRDNRHPVAPA